MMNILNQSTVHLHLTKIKFLPILAVTALVLSAALSLADSAGSQPAQNHLAGTWIKSFEPGVAAPSLLSYMSDGRVIVSGPITILPGPGFISLVGTGHGEWIRTGNHEFASTVMFLGSDLTTEFLFFVKVISAIKLNDASDELTATGTVTVTFTDGFSFTIPLPGSGIYTRIVAGQ
jgi:hypothetical protein